MTLSFLHPAKSAKKKSPLAHGTAPDLAVAGFTLIEVMVAMTILAALTVLTAQALRSGLTNRAKVQADISRESSVHDALRVIAADVAAAFHHRDIAITMFNELLKPDPTATPTNKPGDGTGNSNTQAAPDDPSTADNVGAAPTPHPLGTPRPTPVPTTGFIGDAESMYFTVQNHVRTYRDSTESDQAKVGYFVKSCRGRSALKMGSRKQANTRCLYRGASTVLDEDVTKLQTESVLLENVEKFSLRYIGPDTEEPVTQWKTSGGDAATTDIFPYAVEVTLAVHDKSDPKEKPFGKTILAPIRFPNNPETDPAEQNNGSTNENNQ